MNLYDLLTKLVSQPNLHAKWLNTLSYLENCGARKIASCEHPTLVKEEMLKHAAEEFRHAHYLKQQISKVSSIPHETYSLPYILGGMSTLHYLNGLDLATSRFLREQKCEKSAFKKVAYLLVTYAIEIRAEALYPLYDRVLKEAKSRVAVKSILLEEKEHLQEMRRGIAEIPHGEQFAEKVCALEYHLFERWMHSLLHHKE